MNYFFRTLPERLATIHLFTFLVYFCVIRKCWRSFNTEKLFGWQLIREIITSNAINDHESDRRNYKTLLGAWEVRKSHPFSSPGKSPVVG